MAVTEKVQLYRVDLDTQNTTVEAFATILQPHLPYSLPVLGCLYNGDLDLSKGIRKIQVWTSFPFEAETKPPALFSVITFSGFNDMQLRFFCSGESFSNPPTPEEGDHVRAFLDLFMRALKSEDPIVEGVDSKTALKQENGEGIFLGSLHGRWPPCLALERPWAVPCMKFVYQSGYHDGIPAWDTSTGDWEVAELRESDLEFVNSRAVFARSIEFLRNRIPYSVCIRRKGETGPPVAWELLYPDGSSGMLHVEPGYRKAGLGRKCMAALSAKMAEKYRCTDEKLAGRYPWMRWEMSDVVVGNDAGLRLAASRNGLKQSWISHWVRLTLPE